MIKNEKNNKDKKSNQIFLKKNSHQYPDLRAKMNKK